MFNLFHLDIFKIRHFLNRTIRIVMHLSHRNRTTLTVFLHIQEQQIIILSEHVSFSLVIDDTRMITSRTFSRPHDISFHVPRPSGGTAHGITYTFRTAGRGKSQVIMAVTLIKPRPFLIGFQFADFHNAPRIGNHVFIEFHVIKVGVAPIHVSLPVVIDEYRRVDIITNSFLPYQRLADRVLKRTIRRIGYQYPYAITLNSTIHVEFAVPLHHLHGPSPILLFPPRKSLGCGYRSMVSPIHHVGRSIKLPVEHLKTVCVILIMSRIKEYSVIVNHGSRIGRIFGLDNRILRTESGSSAQPH